MKIGMSSLQPLGRALMLPIAVLPVAGLLLRLGQPDLLDIAFISAAGQAVFANLAGHLCEGTGTNVFYVVDGELHAVEHRHAPHLDRTAQVLVGADHDLGGCDALVGDFGLCERRQGGEADRGAQQGRFQDVKSHSVAS